MSPKLKVMILKIKIKASSSMNNEQLTKKKKRSLLPISGKTGKTFFGVSIWKYVLRQGECLVLLE